MLADSLSGYYLFIISICNLYEIMSWVWGSREKVIMDRVKVRKKKKVKKNKTKTEDTLSMPSDSMLVEHKREGVKITHFSHIKTKSSHQYPQ